MTACLIQSGERPGSRRRSVLLGKDATGEEECFVLSSQHPVQHRQMSLLLGDQGSLVLDRRMKCHFFRMLQCTSFRQLARGC